MTSSLLGSSLIYHKGQLVLLGGTKFDEQRKDEVIMNQDIYNLQLGKGIEEERWSKQDTKLSIGTSKLVKYGNGSYLSLSTGVEKLYMFDSRLIPAQDSLIAKAEWNMYLVEDKVQQFKLEKGANTPPPLTGYSLCYLSNSGNVVLYGGYDLITKGLSNKMFTLDVETKKWQQVQFDEQIPYRYLHSAVCEDSFMYVLGGSNLTHTAGLGYMDKFDLQRNRWSTVNLRGLPPKPRFLSSVHKIQDQLILLGGVDSDHEVYDDLFRLDWNKFSWVPQPKTDKILGTKVGYTFGAASLLINDTLVVSQGWSSLTLNQATKLGKRDQNEKPGGTVFLDVSELEWKLIDFNRFSSQFPSLPKDEEVAKNPFPNDHREDAKLPDTDSGVNTVTLVCSVVFGVLFLAVLVLVIFYFLRKRYRTEQQKATEQPLIKRSTTAMQLLDTIHEVDEFSYRTEQPSREPTQFQTREGEIYPSSLMPESDEVDEVDETEEEIVHVSSSCPKLPSFHDHSVPEVMFDPNEILNGQSFYTTHNSSLPSFPSNASVDPQLPLKATSTLRKPNYDTNLYDSDISVLDSDQHDLLKTQFHAPTNN